VEQDEVMTVRIHEAMEDVEIGFRQLEFAIKLLSYCELDNIKPADFDTDHLVMLEGGSLRFQSGNFSTADDINRAASVAVLLAFSGTVLILDKAFEVAGIKPDPAALDNIVRLRTLVYMLRCAQAHGPADPQWEVRGKYICTLNVDLDGIVVPLDLAALNGQPFIIDQIGGYQNWYRIRNMAVRALSLVRAA
jgi:hypothetical protein